MDVQDTRKFPFEIRDVEPTIANELMSYFKGEHSGFVRVGPKSYFLPKRYEKDAANLYNMPVRTRDVFVVTYPRSGTTLTQELVWLIANDLDYDKAAEIPLTRRFPMIEFPILLDPVLVQQLEEENRDNEENISIVRQAAASRIDKLGQMPSPRFIKSHMPLSLLPPDLLEKGKLVFVARDPRDVAVSCYHHSRRERIHGYVGDFKRYWNYFIEDLIHWTPYFEYVKEGWEKRHHPNMLFLFYEELSKDLPATIQRVAKFLGKDVTEPQAEKLCEHLKIENFKNNMSVNGNMTKEYIFATPDEASFIRKGKVGGWCTYFDDEMMQQADRWIADNLNGTDLRFPQ